MGKAGDLPFAGDWDGNGSVTIGFLRSSEPAMYLRGTHTADVTGSVKAVFGAAGDLPVAGNWDGK